MKNYKQNMIVGWYDIFEGINDKTKNIWLAEACNRSISGKF